MPFFICKNTKYCKKKKKSTTKRPTDSSIREPWHKAVRNLSHFADSRTSPAHHVVLVLQEDAELLEEGDDEHQELLVVPIQSLDQQLDDVLIPHLQLCARVLSQVQEQIQSHWNNTDGGYDTS